MPNFERALVSRRAGLTVRSTCFKCGAHTLGRFDDGSIDSWERTHDCDDPSTPTFLGRWRCSIGDKVAPYPRSPGN